MIPLENFLALSVILFSVGVYGLTTRGNAIRVLMCIELMMNAANINFIAFSAYMTPFNPAGNVFAVFAIAVTVAETAVGLSIYVLINRTHNTVDLRKISYLKG